MNYRHRCGFKVLAMMIPVLLTGCLTTTPSQLSMTGAEPAEDVKELPPVRLTGVESGEKVASMGGVVLEAGELKAWLDRLPKGTRSRLLADEEALGWRIRWEVTRKYLETLAIEDETMIRSGALRRMQQAEEESLRGQYLSAITTPQVHFPDEATLQRTYREGLERSKTVRRVHLRQIFVPFGGNSEAARVKSAALFAMARKNRADFPSLARKLSMDPETAAQGGDMGWKNFATLPQAFKNGLKDVENDAVIGPLETERGYHIVQKVAEAVEGQKSFAEMAESLRRTLRQRQTAENLKRNLARWSEENPIVFNPDGMELLNREFSNQNGGESNLLVQQKIARNP
ncbi:MAG: peptidylprolyl isomerase [Magnetococcales bacterium]|nr:peptidylprolyl isomerase [Magnetococcales bacterium]